MNYLDDLCCMTKNLSVINTVHSVLGRQAGSEDYLIFVVVSDYFRTRYVVS